MEFPDDLIRQIDDIETDESNAYCQLKRDQVIEEESRIDQIARIISDPIVAYVQGFDMVITDGMDGADWDYFEWWKVRRSYMRCAPERFWKYSVRDAFIYGEKDGHFARMICEGPLI